MRRKIGSDNALSLDIPEAPAVSRPGPQQGQTHWPLLSRLATPVLDIQTIIGLLQSFDVIDYFHPKVPGFIFIVEIILETEKY